MNYHNIITADMMNGSGLRVVLWLSGCSHHCYNCQNPQTWDENSGIPFDKPAKEELFRELDKDYISGLTLTGGDPLHESNLDGVLDLVNRIRLSSPKKSIWLYTGYTLFTCKYFGETIFTFNPSYYCLNPLNGKPIKVNNKAFLVKQDRKRIDILKNIDVLIDGQYIESQRNVSLPWCGSENQKVIDIQQSLQKGEIVLWQT